ncbi:salivary C-type lectin 1-like [Saccoglossus kowalevskii]|uniref:C-type lectin domain family 18 member A-like n=1 Tax=Saccoglossus kowalevskii TaxID=10224 RepID=A0ABM0H1E1_SACKO|nr:PREDICTED: C-type lectin domain family 18 member A-like [Saccoglossus kowalevskii]
MRTHVVKILLCWICVVLTYHTVHGGSISTCWPVSNCDHGTMDGATCVCDAGWSGLCCDEQPIECQNNENSICFDCIRYQVFTKQSETGRLSWTAARSKCEELGGNLAMPHTQSINKDVRQFIFNNDLDDEVRNGLWIGLHRNGEGNFEWVNPSINVDFTHWAGNQPNNHRNEQHCVQLWKRRSMKWDDAKCGVKKSYICEFSYCA